MYLASAILAIPANVVILQFRLQFLLVPLSPCLKYPS
jgi:hypothetical protein